MIINNDFRKDWIDLMSKYIDSNHTVYLYTPDKYATNGFFTKIKASIKIQVSVIEKYTRSIKIQYTLVGHTFEDIIYLPTSSPITKVIDNFNDKLYKMINNWLKINDPNFVETQYANFKIGIPNKKDRIVAQREKKLKRLDGRV